MYSRLIYKATTLAACVLSVFLVSMFLSDPINAQVCGGLSGLNQNNLVQNSGFEESNAGEWQALSGEAISIVNDTTAAGCQVMRVSERVESWHGVIQTVNGLERGKYYQVAMQIKTGTTADFSMTLKYDAGSTTVYHKPISTAVPAGGWHVYEGLYKHEGTSSLQLYIEQGDGDVVPEFYVDEIILRPLEVGNWKQDANQRITQVRRGPLTVKVLDESGNPVAGAQVELRQTRSEFGFGTVINPYARDSQQYRSFLKNNFEWVTIDSIKWPAVEAVRNNADYSLSDYLFNFADQNDLSVRMHNIFWDAPQYLPNWLTDLNLPQIEQEVDQRVDALRERYQNQPRHIDVVNEMLDTKYHYNQHGVGFRKSIYEKTATRFPNSMLFINEYNIANKNARLDKLDKLIAELEDANTPIDGIGVQAHFYEDDIDPYLFRYNLEKIATHGYPIWITEYDFVHSDANFRAENLEESMRTAFSIPEVKGFVLWDFYEPVHWRKPNAGLVEADWTINASGQKYQQLRNEWRTHETITSNNNGVATIPAFYGEYDVTVTYPDQTKKNSPLAHTQNNPLSVMVNPGGFQVANSCPLDFNTDGLITIIDFSIFAFNYRKPNINCAYDLVGDDCYLNIRDFSYFANYYKINTLACTN